MWMPCVVFRIFLSYGERRSRCALNLLYACILIAVTGLLLMSDFHISSYEAANALWYITYVPFICRQCQQTQFNQMCPFVLNSDDPIDYLVSKAPKDLPIELFTQLENGRSTPFTVRLNESRVAINNARSTMDIVSR